jgi:hypothetical protein
MLLPAHPFQIIDWTDVPEERHKGERGHAIWQVIQLGEIRIRRVEYTAGYQADHWCTKGHIIHCMEGSMVTALEDGRRMPLSKGMTYIVGDGNEAHCTSSEEGCTLFIVD